MDDNDNIMDFQKMNFSPFAATQFAGLSANAVNQFAASKFAQNITGANGQIVGVVSGGDGGVSYLRPIDNNNSGPFSPTSNHLTSNHQQNQSQHNNQQQNQQQHHQSMNESSIQQHHHQQQHQALITLPITMPGAKPGDAAQTVHIQVINPNPIPQPTTQTKFPIGQMQIPIQGFQSGNTTVLTVAYSPQDGKFISNHGFPEGMTVVAALQPQDLQILAQAQAQAQAQVNAQLLSNQQQQQNENHHQQHQQQHHQNHETVLNMNGNLSRNLNHDEIIVKQEPTDWDSTTALTNSTQSDLSEFITTHSQGTSLPMTLTPFLKFNPNSIKYETPDFTSEKFDAEQLINRSDTSPTSNPNNDSSMLSSTEQNSSIDEGNTINTITNGDTAKQKRKRRVKKPKVVKPKPPKPGQVLIATTIDGTVLFCCPECQMAYPEKENLEQHLTEHKIERRYICDICGAGLKRKEHLERHKSGHNPERPYICSVCMKGFKRKEHLNLHFVIHSGEKNEICGECGKGFYRKDHLRKHTNSHIAKRLKEEMNAREGISPTTPKTKKIKQITAINISDGSGIGGGVGCVGGNGINNNNNDKNSINNNNNNNEIQSSLARNDNNNMIMHTAIQIGDSVNPHNIQLNPLQLTSTLNNNNNNKNSNSNNNNNNNNRDNNTLISDNNNAINISINPNCGNTQTTQPAISLSTVYVPTSNNTTLPVQIQIPQIITTSKPDGTTESTIVMPSTTESQNSTAMSTS